MRVHRLVSVVLLAAVALGTQPAAASAADTSNSTTTPTSTTTPSPTSPRSPTTKATSTRTSPRSTSSRPTTTTPSRTSTGSSTSTSTSTSSTASTPTPVLTVTPPPPEPGLEEALSAQQVAEQVAEAGRLRKELGVANAKVAAATARLKTVSAQVSTALERQRSAEQAAQAAQSGADEQLSRLINLHVRVAQGEADLGRWAREAYATGGPMAEYEGWITALEGRSTSQVAGDLALLQHLGVVSTLTLDRLQDARVTQQLVAAQAAAAAIRAKTAEATARRARARAAGLLKAQKVVLARLQAAQAATADRAQKAGVELGRLKSAAALAARAQLDAEVSARSRGLSVPLDPDDCQGLDISGYPNGQIPKAALCPLWGAPGLVLRADAAAAFRAMSKAYARQFGTPICVTDAYRSRAEQVVVYAKKPGLAARPGTSNHGWGVAADLCGGIQSFGTVEHAWLLVHSGQFGWFHPSWAEPSGSKPEPWHWEFAG